MADMSALEIKNRVLDRCKTILIERGKKYILWMSRIMTNREFLFIE